MTNKTNKIMKYPVFGIFLLLALTPLSSKAQAYGTAIGGRFADGYGLTLQQQFAVGWTAEGILQSGFSSKDVTASLLIENHKGLLSRGLSFYAGAGLYHTWLEEPETPGVVLKDPTGISPIVGLELTLAKLNISADFKPNIKVSGDGKAFSWHTGVSVRYVLAGRYFKNEDWKFWKKWKKKK
jgi:hypothetical protein